MTTAEWLSGYRYYIKLFNMLTKKKKELLHDNIKVTTNPEAVWSRAQGGNSVDERNAKYADKAVQLQQQIDISEKNYKNIEIAIEAVSKPKYKYILKMKFIYGASWEKIAEDLELSEKWVREQLYLRAIKDVERVIKEKGIEF